MGIDPPLIMQVVDWSSMDAYDADTNREDYMVKLFGVTEDGRSASVNVTKYTPSFYVTFTNSRLHAIPPNVLDTFQNLIVAKLPGRLKQDLPRFEENVPLSTLDKEQMRSAKDNIVKLVPCERKDMVGFTGDDTRKYLRLIFRSAEVARYVRYNVLMRRAVQANGESKSVPAAIMLTGISTKVIAYESNIDPLLRFMHYRNIQPSGWVRVENYEEEHNVAPSTNQLNVTAAMWDVHPHDTPKIAPLVVMSFDLECTSSHGDFPVARKNYSKPANELVDLHRKYRERFEDKHKEVLLDAICGMFLIGKNRDLSRVYPKKQIEDKIALERKIRTDMRSDIMNILTEGTVTNEEGETETAATRLTRKMNAHFPPLKGDRIIQIGTAVHRYGDTSCSYKAVVTLDTCDPIEGVDVISCATEKELIKRWCDLLHQINPDVIIGYNILGFDFDYLHSRSAEVGCKPVLEACGRLVGVPSAFKEQKLASSALGDNTFKYMEWKGRVIIDVMKVVQRDHKLDSYKLDHVASVFITGQIRTVEEDPRTVVLDNTKEIHEGDFLQMGDQKARSMKIEGDRVILSEAVRGQPRKWGLVKDDVHPKQIFECQKGTSADRRVIAKYCVQDCALCNLLLIKLEMLANNIGMSNVCCVPLSYIFMRGQGIKIFSLVSKQCKEDKIVVPVLSHELEEEDDGYEGAIVLDPTPGIYTEPVSVMDYASLYPSSMISENISHDSLVIDEAYDNLPGYEYVDITYDVYQGKGDEKRKVGEKTCRYAQFPDNKKGILPRILMKLLAQRKLTRKKMLYESVRTADGRELVGLVKEGAGGVLTIADAEGGPKTSVAPEEVMDRRDTYDEFAKAVLDGLQLAYKVTANSLYGQVGARTSPIYRKELAASTTATGRNLILRAKDFMERHYDARTIYGDTDSVFVDFKVKEKYGLEGLEALQKSIDISMEASAAFKLELKAPHDLEYEKTFWPFVILSKKKYIGNLYEHDVNKFKQKGMGIVLKRRDNANILKRVYGGIIDIILQHKELSVALEFLKTSLDELVAGNYPLEELVITKTLRGTYADPTRIAHKVLADRMFLRDPGSAPQVNDRIPYVYVEHDRNDKSLLQGDKIEDPAYIREKSIRPDYTFYISNQLQNPISQLLSLSLESLPGYRKGNQFYINIARKFEREGMSEKKIQKRVAHLREVDTRNLLFTPTLTNLELKRKGMRKITEFFGVDG
jgi:DNA polymerase elongation subunit (family B)